MLIAMDLPWEGLFILLKKNPLYLFLVPLWLTSGPARLTHIDVFLVDCEAPTAWSSNNSISSATVPA